MYDINDTICAISSAAVAKGTIAKSIIRISGVDAFGVLSEFCDFRETIGKRGVVTATVIATSGVEVEAAIYFFRSPNSYTGEDLVELHFFGAAVVVELILGRICESTRLAEPGEFTLRAYLNGRIDLSQAEAVAEIVSSSNSFQLQAAQKLLAGKLADTAGGLRKEILDVLSLIEAGMDFSGEDIEFVTTEKAIETVTGIGEGLEGLLAGSIRCEEMIDLPSVGLAGVSNAGKSSLLNVLVGHERSIVSEEQATTRDVLTGVLELRRGRCMLFDCAGLGVDETAVDLIDQLGRQAAIEAINSANLILFCVDLGKDDYAEDIEVRKLIKDKDILLVGTKSDLLSDQQLKQKCCLVNELFGQEVVATSSANNEGVEQLRSLIEEKIVQLMAGSAEAADKIAINQRHRETVTESIDNLSQAIPELAGGNDEVAAMLLRLACEKLGGIEKEDIDEAVLERIFENFCIGK